MARSVVNDAKKKRAKPTFNVFKGKDGLWYVNLKGRNGQIMMHSEGYTRLSSAHRAKKRIWECILEIGFE